MMDSIPEKAERYTADVQRAIGKCLLPCLAGICTEYAECDLMYFEEALLRSGWSRKDGNYPRVWDAVPEGNLKERYSARIQYYIPQLRMYGISAQVLDAMRKAAKQQQCHRLECFYKHGSECVCGYPIIPD